MISKKNIYLIVFAAIILLFGFYNYYKLNKEKDVKPKIKVLKKPMPQIKPKPIEIKPMPINKEPPKIAIKESKDDISFDLDDLDDINQPNEVDDFSLSLLDMDQDVKKENESLPESLESF